MAYLNGNKILNVNVTGLVNIDAEMSDTSENPVQNKVVKEYVDGRFDNFDVGSIKIDQTYNPQSENAQSGIAVAQAVRGKADKDNWELIEGIVVKEEAIVSRTYSDKYKKILVCVQQAEAPRVRLIGDNSQYWEFYTYTNHQYNNLFVFGEIVVPNAFSNVYTIAGNHGGSANHFLSVIERFKNTATSFKGFTTDAVCKVGTNITVYGVKA